MTAKKSKGSVYIYLVLTIAGIVIACSSLITNDYLKLFIVMVTLAVGLYGIMKSLSTPSEEKENANND